MKYDRNPDFGKSEKSPSTRREWIEIGGANTAQAVYWSPSTRREWIEIGAVAYMRRRILSPSTRREWIEMHS